MGTCCSTICCCDCCGEDDQSHQSNSSCLNCCGDDDNHQSQSSSGCFDCCGDNDEHPSNSSSSCFNCCGDDEPSNSSNSCCTCFGCCSDDNSSHHSHSHGEQHTQVAPISYPPQRPMEVHKPNPTPVPKPQQPTKQPQPSASHRPPQPPVAQRPPQPPKTQLQSNKPHVQQPTKVPQPNPPMAAPVYPHGGQYTSSIPGHPETFIAVMGAMGSGKTTLINLLSGSQLAVGNSIRPCTKVVQAAKPFHLDGRTITLIDTPGFDAKTRSDADILRVIAHFLAVSYQQGKPLAGIIFVHSLASPRITTRSLRLLRQLCGDAMLKNVVIITNKWGILNATVAQGRENALYRDPSFVRPLLDKGAVLMRHENATSVYSAQQILRQAMRNYPPPPLRIQLELVVERKDISQTAAAQMLNNEVLGQTAKLEREMNVLKAQMQRAKQANDKRKVREIHDQSTRLRQQIIRNRSDTRKLAFAYNEQKARAEKQRKLQIRKQQPPRANKIKPKKPGKNSVSKPNKPGNKPASKKKAEGKKPPGKKQNKPAGKNAKPKPGKQLAGKATNKGPQAPPHAGGGFVQYAPGGHSSHHTTSVYEEHNYHTVYLPSGQPSGPVGYPGDEAWDTDSFYGSDFSSELSTECDFDPDFDPSDGGFYTDSDEEEDDDEDTDYDDDEEEEQEEAHEFKHGEEHQYAQEYHQGEYGQHEQAYNPQAYDYEGQQQPVEQHYHEADEPDHSHWHTAREEGADEDHDGSGCSVGNEGDPSGFEDHDQYQHAGGYYQ